MRSALKLSVRKFAKHVGVAPGTVYNWEHGTIPKGLYREKLITIAEENGIDLKT